MKLRELFKIHLMKRLPALIGAVAIVLLFSLYYVGILDLSFIDRPEEWNDNIELLYAMIDPSSAADKEPQGENEPEIVPSEDESSEKEDEEDKKRPQNRPQTDPSTPRPELMPTYKTVAEMKADGYYLTDKPWDDTTVFAKLVCEYDWPREFSYSWKTYYKEVETEFIDGTETTAEAQKFTGERAALELYMGYIIYDDDDALYLIGPDGAVLLEYDDKTYIPAYTRDLEGRPLFYKVITRNEKYPKILGVKDENGNYKWDKTATLTYEDKEYYYLAADGKTFKKSDYKDASDNRGLYFDYPSYYGTAENKLSRYYFNTTKFLTDPKGDTHILDRMNWAYSKDKIDLSELKFDMQGLLINKDGTKNEEKTLSEMFPYSMAYNYSEGYAAVFKDIDWSYDHDVKNAEGKIEKKTFDVSTNELRVINEKGEIMFDAKKNYYSPEFNWTSHERFVAPLFSDIRSIGSYYFDHGLMRIRIQTYDCYMYSEFDTVKIVTDDDVLINPKGEIFQIPSGYDLISYSDGILLLEKDGLYGFMNYMGNWVRDPEYPDAGPFLEGVAVLCSKEGNYGMVNTEGEIVIPFIYDYVSTISSGTVVAYNETTGWTVYQKMTK